MKCSKRSFTLVSALFAVLPSSSTVTLNARDADLASRTFAAAQTAKQQCINTCRARHRSCLSAKQIPSIECRGIYQDCTRYTCNAGPVWSTDRIDPRIVEVQQGFSVTASAGSYKAKGGSTKLT